MGGDANGYLISTQYINSSLTGTARTVCTPSYFGYFVPTPTSIWPELPSTTAYTYSTLLPFGVTSWNTTSAFLYGLNSLASEVATYLHLTIPACSSAGGGSGTVKIAVTALTSVSTAYTNVPQAVSQTTESPQPSPGNPQPAPPSQPLAPPAPTASTSAAPPVIPPQPSLSLGQAVLPTPVTQIVPISTTVPPGAPSKPGSPNSGSYTTTIVETTAGPSGLETLSETTTLPLGSYILSIMGITGGTGAATTSTSNPAFSSGSGTTLTGPGAPEFTGNACRMNTDVSWWATRLVLAWLTLGILF